MSDVTRILDSIQRGDPNAGRELLPLVYEELRKLATALRVNEEAAQKRVVRALEKLRKIISRRGMTITSTVIAGAVAANSVQAAPAGLAQAVTATVMTHGAVLGASTLTLIKGTLKIMAWAKVKTTATITAASLIAVCATTVIAGKIIQSRGRADELLKSQTFVTEPGNYHWNNPSALGELTFRDNKTRSITIGTSQEPPAGTTILDYWTNAPSESRLTISSNEVRFVTSDGSHESSTAINTWHLGNNWFIYRAKGMRVWAYDGERGLWMLTATPLGSESASIEYLQEQPPTAILERLPSVLKKQLPTQSP